MTMRTTIQSIRRYGRQYVITCVGAHLNRKR